jgi:hypothetical protein
MCLAPTFGDPPKSVTSPALSQGPQFPESRRHQLHEIERQASRGSPIVRYV